MQRFYMYFVCRAHGMIRILYGIELISTCLNFNSTTDPLHSVH